jgi:hypothetical protein
MLIVVGENTGSYCLPKQLAQGVRSAVFEDGHPEFARWSAISGDEVFGGVNCVYPPGAGSTNYRSLPVNDNQTTRRMSPRRRN